MTCTQQWKHIEISIGIKKFREIKAKYVNLHTKCVKINLKKISFKK